jgi:FixJ family two-component response regulator
LYGCELGRGGYCVQSQAELLQQRVAHRIEEAMPQSAQIAIIDDDERVRSSVASLIRSLGLTAIQFPSADDFILSGRRDFSCVITDVNMPGMSGLELQRTVANWPDVLPVIVMSGYRDGSDDYALGGDNVRFIEKPLDDAKFISCLEEWLGPLE